MFGKLGLFWDALQVGKEIANPEMWKSHQITANKIVLLLTTLLGIAHAYGLKINMDSETVMAVGGGIYGLANWLITLATSKKVGLPITTLSGAQQAGGSVQSSVEAVQGAQSQQAMSSVNSPPTGETDRARRLTEQELSTTGS